jgi:hypothetical protein
MTTTTTMQQPKQLQWSNILVVAVAAAAASTVLLLDGVTSFQHTTVTATRIRTYPPTPTTKTTFLPASMITTSTTKTTTATTTDNEYTLSASSSISTRSLVEEVWKSIETLGLFQWNPNNNRRMAPISPGTAFLQAVANQDIDQAMTYIDNTVVWVDTAYPSPLDRPQLERQLRLQAQQQKQYSTTVAPTTTSTTTTAPPRMIMIEKDIYDPVSGKAGVIFRRPTNNNQKCAVFFQLNQDRSLIQKAFYIQEHQKLGAVNLQILKIASDIINLTSSLSSSSSSSSSKAKTANATKSTTSNNINNNNGHAKIPTLSTLSLPEQYFAAWNQRDMMRASSFFSSTIEYDDTAFPKPFQGKDALTKHLDLCADALPPGFSFCVDDKIDVGDQVMVRWHVENDGQELPFTKGCSYYEIENGKINRGTDWIEPAVFKTGSVNLFVATTWQSVNREPARFIPLTVWLIYCYVVFFSDWFFGVPIQAMETRTWEEVRDLSLNFFFVSPILGLPFAPVIHPGLEGIFNLLLSWAALFAAFLSDDRPRKPNPLPMLPMVMGMQFLTSAFFLPYLVSRSTEMETNVTREDLSAVSRATESRWFSLVMGLVGTGSMVWAIFARPDEFGNIQERYSSLITLLSIDRVGSSFVVDLAIFALFQGWMVDDDLKRRGVDVKSVNTVLPRLLYQVAKYVPFFGMVTYLTCRPSFPSQPDQRKQ